MSRRPVLGVDPGGRWTALALIDPAATWGESLLTSCTVERIRPEGEPLAAVPVTYLREVHEAILEIVREHEPALIAVEGVRRPTGFAKGKKHTLDPEPLLATAIVLGAIIGRVWGPELVIVPPGRNGSALAADRYPAGIASRPGGKGGDKLRHERSAFDVAHRGRATASLLTRSRGPFA